MSPESARPRTAGTSMPGLHFSRNLALRPGGPLGEGPHHAKHLIGLLRLGVCELADRLVEGGGERPAQRLVGAGLELAGPPRPLDRPTTQRIEEHGLADSAQPGERHAGSGRPAATRSSATPKAASSRSRPASSGGR